MAALNDLMGSALDISEHLGLLRGLAMDPEVRQIVEIGFRDGVSATALASAGKPLTCYDVEKCTKGVQKLRRLAENFSFVHGNSLEVKIPKCELLHIDSLHTYDHLREELRALAPSCSKWIALHDTQTFGRVSKGGTQAGLMDAIENFLVAEGSAWSIHLHLRNNNGMTLLRKKA